MALFDRNRFRALVSAFMLSAVLICGGGEAIGGDSGEEESAPRVTSMRLNGNIFFSTTTAATYHLSRGTIGAITSGFTSNTFIISADITKDTPELRLRGVLRNTGERADLRLGNGAVVAGVVFSDTAPTHGRVHLHNVDTITLDGGTVNGNIDASRATADTTFNLMSGTITGNVIGGDEDDSFIIGAGFASSGRIDGRGGLDTLRLATGFTPTLANLFGGILTLTFSGGRLDLTLANIETIDIAGLTMVELPLIDRPLPPVDMPMVELPPVDMPMVELPPVDMPMPSLVFTATVGDDVFAISRDITGSPERPLVSVIDGLGGQDELQLNEGAVVARVFFNAAPPTNGRVHLQNVETITLDGGTVTGGINVRNATAGITFNLHAGAVGGNVVGSSKHDDIFIISGDMTGDNPALAIGGVIKGNKTGFYFYGRKGAALHLIEGAVVDNLAFSNQAPTQGDVHLQYIDTITLNGGTVRGNIGTSGSRGGESMTFNLRAGAIFGNVISLHHADVFIISGDMTGDNPALAIGGVIQGWRNNSWHSLHLIEGAVVDNLAFSNRAPTQGDVHLQRIKTITLNGGTVSGNIDVSARNGDDGGVNFNLRAGAIFGNVITSSDTYVFGYNEFTISGDMTGPNPALAIGGVLQGGSKGIIRLDDGAVVDSITFSDLAPSGGAIHLQNMLYISLVGGRVNGNIDASAAEDSLSFALSTGSIFGDVIGSRGYDEFIITGDMTGANPELAINGVIDGGGGEDRIRLRSRVASITFSDQAPTGGALHLQNIESIWIDGGTVIGNVDASNAPRGVKFFFFGYNRVGTILGNLIGSDHADRFEIYGIVKDNLWVLDGSLTIGGYLDGGGGRDVLFYQGASGASGTDFPDVRFGLAEDGDTTDNLGSVRNIECQANLGTYVCARGAGGGGAPTGGAPADSAPAGLSGLGVRGIEVLELSPALNLYGALSDALMQFGAQTAQGFALADLNLATGRATSAGV